MSRVLIDREFIEKFYSELNEGTRERVDEVASRIIEVKKRGGKVAVVTGSGPNIHEGVTTLIAELIDKGIVDGVITSSAVVAHEMAGSLDRVKRVDGKYIGVKEDILPRGGTFEITIMDDDTLNLIKKEMIVDEELIEKGLRATGEVIVKAAGNLGYPVGLRTERVSLEVEKAAKLTGKPFEYIAGLGADPLTMIGAGAKKGVPVIVSAPQIIGGGLVGLCIADSISMKQRSEIIARMLSEASVIIESGIALSQEIHDGPFETYTGHGIWSSWDGLFTFSLRGKTLVRIDLDPNLQKVWDMERGGGDVQKSIDMGLPKTKTLKVPFRMEMSGFARLEGSIPIVGDIGVVWPVIAFRVANALGVKLDFISYPQESSQGKAMREWIVDNIQILDRALMYEKLRNLGT